MMKILMKQTSMELVRGALNDTQNQDNAPQKQSDRL